ncbi:MULTISPECIES: nSTAND1 domain-containing NTPase [Leptolyngbya]|nr:MULTISPECIES: ATP-binding protein [Leptolyngbya]BAS56596.1 hypothetical protein LBWT_25190 [Leptolyngbya boryana IAM M-101]MBD2367024.1 ATP-binding protein [Leptolyngbya sp. FACHB-161]MBD2373622.1 ATP-binding protein [Leptolyngbya sp. FACHB-238]MBD2398031.1 ATP-binding protein [Leptolyngbya sp. FACHB-239]MBD2404533.1 ATP-binding protein [Leptolyngbya sp. FACHB-402]
MLTERKFFVGRRDQIRFILSRMTNDQPTSVNVVGDRRVGKSSLLYHIYQSYEEQVTAYGRRAEEFVVVYLSLRDGNCRKPEDFYQAVADQLLQRQRVLSNPILAQPLQQSQLNGSKFFRAMDAWKQAKVLPVVCLDNFEELLDPESQFDDGFYDNLRALQGRSEIMLIIASRRKLREYKQKGRTSEFFNVSQTEVLQDLSESEAQDLVRLPDTQNPALSEERQQLALKWADRHPYLLQLAALYLWEARQFDKSNEWAQRRFEEDARGVPRRVNPARMVFMGIGRLGQWGQQLGDTADDWGNFLKGMVTLVLLGLALTGVVKWSNFGSFMQDFAGEILKNMQTQPDQKGEGK